MSQQPEQTTLPFAANPAPQPGSASASASEVRPALQRAAAPQRIPHWLENTELLLRLLVRGFIGLFFLVAPWAGQLFWFFPRLIYVWDQNPLILFFPVIAHYAALGAVRGVVSGLGILNLWFALLDALHHRYRNG
ncbi:MAG: hypothetical protein WB424_13065 [Terracidiphilus sp.]|jgi:hypothetical protein